MLKRSSELGVKLQVAASEIITPIHDWSTNTWRPGLNDRLLKLLEELGEVSEAHTDCIEGRKGKTAADVREEKVDVYIVSSDIMYLFGQLPGQCDADMAQQLSQELLEMLLAGDAPSCADTASCLAEVVKHLGQVWSEAAALSPELRAFSLGELHAACTRLLLAPEVAPATQNPSELASLTFERAQGLIGVVKAKTGKWRRTRLMDAATCA